MSDNITVSAAVGTGPTISTKDVSAVQHPTALAEFESGASTTRVSAADPMPVVQTGTPGLPTGASTSALQTSNGVLLGAVTETAPGTDTASSGLNGRLQRIAQRLTTILAQLGFGQAVMASSLPVAIASNQSAVPISAASLPLPALAATSTLQSSTEVLVGAVTETAPASDTASSGLNGRLQRIAQRITSMIALLPGSLGQKTMANSLAVTLASDQSALAISAASLPLPTGAATDAKLDTVITDLGTVTEAAPGTDTASSGLNGRLQRIAQRLTSLIALLPTSLGTKTAANSLAITPSSDGNFAIGDGTNLAAIQTVGADAVSNTANRLRVTNTNMGFNGSTFDRLRAGVTGESGAATGYLNVLPATGAVSGASIVSTTGATEASRVLKASAGTLMSLVGYNNKTAAQFIQLFNSTTVPADTTVPIYTFTVPAKSNFSIDVPVTGMPFTTGIAVANSSTLATKTIGSADCFFTAVIK